MMIAARPEMRVRNTAPHQGAANLSYPTIRRRENIQHTK
jgi:hypothetical protein